MGVPAGLTVRVNAESMPIDGPRRRKKMVADIPADTTCTGKAGHFLT